MGEGGGEEDPEGKGRTAAATPWVAKGTHQSRDGDERAERDLHALALGGDDDAVVHVDVLVALEHHLDRRLQPRRLHAARPAGSESQRQ